MRESEPQQGLAIESRGLGKRFGGQWAVDGVDLKVEAGSVYGFLGRNGAGKTTTIRLILGLLRPTRGSVSVFGFDVARDRIGAARQTGSLLEARATYDQLSGRENLDSTRRMLGLPATEIDRVLGLVEMAGAAGRKVGHYSLGMRQRLGLARALLGGPRLLVLDEPMNGLDPDGIRDMRAVIRALPERTGATVLLSSHLLSEVEQIATHIGLMHDGQLVLQGPIGDLLKAATADLHIRTPDVARATALLGAAGYAPIAQTEGLSIALSSGPGGGDAEAARVNRRLVEGGCAVAALSLRHADLEALYMRVQQDRRVQSEKRAA
jgi:ABC-type multidrug transport system ATPase subunit